MVNVVLVRVVEETYSLGTDGHQESFWVKVPGEKKDSSVFFSRNSKTRELSVSRESRDRGAYVVEAEELFIVQVADQGNRLSEDAETLRYRKVVRREILEKVKGLSDGGFRDVSPREALNIPMAPGEAEIFERMAVLVNTVMDMRGSMAQLPQKNGSGDRIAITPEPVTY